MSIITLTIETGNDSFRDESGGCVTVGQILQGAAKRFGESSYLISLDGMALRDSNGNRVGQVEVK